MYFERYLKKFLLKKELASWKDRGDIGDRGDRGDRGDFRGGRGRDGDFRGAGLEISEAVMATSRRNAETDNDGGGSFRE